MGFYRFALAIGVVFYHVGNANWVVGRVAVFCFYFISGFLICRVLDTSYRGGLERLAAFYGNRALRLFPLYLVITAATILIFSLHGSATFPRGAGTVTLLDDHALLVPSSLASWLPLPRLAEVSPLPLLQGSTEAIPQGWSIAVELAFYLIAPILVLVARRHVGPLILLAVIATAAFLYVTWGAPDRAFIDKFVYKNALTSAFMFLWGGATYVVWRDTTFRVPFYLSAVIVALAVYYVYVWSASNAFGTRTFTTNAFVANMLLGIPVSALVCLTAMPAWLRRWESRLGDLSYGIYLNHFLVAGLLLWIAEAYGAQIFGIYNKPQFGVYAALGCVLMAALTFNLVERPVEILRRKIKSRASVQPIPVPEQAPAIATPAA